MTRDLTKGSETRAMVLFSLPMIAGNMLQQMYNIVDTLIIGRVLGANALAAVGSAFSLMVFLTSINLGFCMGSGVVFSHLFGAKKEEDLKTSVSNAFVFIGGITLAINLLAFVFLDSILRLINIQPEVFGLTRTYLQIILCGMFFVFLYNFFASALRSVGNSVVPLLALLAAALINIVLDIYFVVSLGWGIAGAAWATIIAQGVSAAFVGIYFWQKAPAICPRRSHFHFHSGLLRRIISNSVLSSVQQSVMNFGILMIQGLVNSYGVSVMAAFAAAVKIDAFAYLPVQDFGNAFATFIAQNHGANRPDRIRTGIRKAVRISILFSLCVTLFVVLLAKPLMLIFVSGEETEIIRIGVRYLRIEGTFYALIGCLFLLYGFYRGLSRSGMSVVLTIISLGSRVALAYLLSPRVGLTGIWWAIPIGWGLADITGFGWYLIHRKKLLGESGA